MADTSTAVLLCLGCPAGLTFGIDTKHWQLGPKFCGVQKIPPGLHFVYHSSGHDTGSGEFIDVSGGDVLVRRWDDTVETFGHSLSGVSYEETQRAVAAVRHGVHDSGLGPYPAADVSEQWQQLTAHVTVRTLARAGVPVGTRVVPGDSEPDAADAAPGTHEQLVPFMDNLPRAPRFSPVAARRLAGMTAEQVTAYNLSPDVRLARLLAEEYGGREAEFLAEFELAFVLFLLLSSLPAFEHWKAALYLVATCSSAGGATPALTLGVLTALMQQLALTPEDMFHDALTSDNFLRPALTALAHGAAAACAPPELRDAGEQLQLYVQSRFGLRLSPSLSAESLEDEAPTVAEVEDSDVMRDAQDEVVAEGAAEPSAPTQQRMSWMLPAPPPPQAPPAEVR